MRGLTAGATYEVRVAAANKHGKSEALQSEAIVAKYPFDLPEAPNAPKTSEVGRDRVTLTWNKPNDGGMTFSYTCVQHLILQKS